MPQLSGTALPPLLKTEWHYSITLAKVQSILSIIKSKFFTFCIFTDFLQLYFLSFTLKIQLWTFSDQAKIWYFMTMMMKMKELCRQSRTQSGAENFSRKNFLLVDQELSGCCANSYFNTFYFSSSFWHFSSYLVHYCLVLKWNFKSHRTQKETNQKNGCLDICYLL